MKEKFDLEGKVGLTEENIQMIMNHPEIFAVVIAAERKYLLNMAKNYFVELFTEWYELAFDEERRQAISKETPIEVLIPFYLQNYVA